MADRSFAGLVGLALIPYALVGLFGCGFLSVVTLRVAADGWGGLTADGRDLRPAVLLFGLVSGSTLLGLRSVHRQLAATRSLGAAVAERRADPAPQLEAAARLAGVRRVDEVRDPFVYSFAYGIRAPRVVVSSGLVDACSSGELEAVLRHERHHLRKRDTAKLVVARAARSAFFFLPATHHLTNRYLAGRELAADRAAIRAVGERALAGALCHAFERPTWTNIDAAAAMSGGTLEHRVTQIETGAEPPLPTIPRTAVVLTAAALVALAITFAIAVAASRGDVLSMDGTMPSGTAGVSGALIASAACALTMAVLPAWFTLRRARPRR